MIALILGTLGVGLVLGCLGLMPAGYGRHADKLITWAVNLLFLAVGVDLGRQQGTWRELALLGPGAFLVPLGVTVGSLAGAALAGLALGLPWNEGAAVGAGFGWYSLSGVLITQLHSVRLGTVAFLSNVLRESLSIIILPWVYRYLGTLAAIAPGGATTMDVTLPVIVKVAGQEAGPVAFASGFILTLLVPLLVPLLL
ncbi:MAG TPA: lysine exporter LysO family protein [Firmicutes bacterium]|nr:lysine exporter LysO family protein [Bacillota bacterium]